MKITDKIEITNEDNMELMKRYSDGFFDLAVIDPPYGIGANKMTLGNGKKKIYRGEKDWDLTIPNKEFFDELFRVSKNQIIWGGNYMTEFLKPTGAWLFWDKQNGNTDFADGELAWTSFDGALRKITKQWIGANAKDGIERIHPTQKPVPLFEYLIRTYTNKGDTVLDNCMGSGTTAIACLNTERNFIGFELNEEYYNMSLKRISENE